MTYRYREIDVSGIGPFVDDSKLIFSDGITVVKGGNGLGMTTLCRALVDEYSNYMNSVDGKTKPFFPEWVYFYDGWGGVTPLLREGVWWNFRDLFAKTSQINLDRRKLVSAISNYASLLMYTNRNNYNEISLNEQLIITVDEDYRLSVRSAAGKSLNYNWNAGEEQVLHLSLLRAVRDQLSLTMQPPLICDDPFGMLDESRINKVLPFILSVQTQIILVLGSGSRYLHLKPNYILTRESGLNGSSIKKLY